MGQVLRLSDFRKPAKAAQVSTSAPDHGSTYYCMRCDADLFKLHPSGQVECASCGAVIRNILISETAGLPQRGREP